MKSEPVKIAGVDDYIAGFPENIQKLLQQLRSIILKAAPGAEEVISYQMPAYKLHGMLVYYAGYAKHIGFYPMPAAIKAFAADLVSYKTSKGAIQFPIDKPLPVQLIKKIIAFRKSENMAQAELKVKKK